jgi:hypothetical protein
MYAFVEVDPIVLSVKVPVGAKNSEKVLSEAVYDDDFLNEIAPAVKEPKSIAEYVTVAVLNNTGDKALIKLGVSDGPYGRLYPVDEAELIDWDAGVMGLPTIKEDVWLTLAEFEAKLLTPEYLPV